MCFCPSKQKNDYGHKYGFMVYFDYKTGAVHQKSGKDENNEKIYCIVCEFNTHIKCVCVHNNPGIGRRKIL